MSASWHAEFFEENTIFSSCVEVLKWVVNTLETLVIHNWFDKYKEMEKKLSKQSWLSAVWGILYS